YFFMKAALTARKPASDASALDTMNWRVPDGLPPLTGGSAVLVRVPHAVRRRPALRMALSPRPRLNDRSGIALPLFSHGNRVVLRVGHDGPGECRPLSGGHDGGGPHADAAVRLRAAARSDRGEKFVDHQCVEVGPVRQPDRAIGPVAAHVRTERRDLHAAV